MNTEWLKRKRTWLVAVAVAAIVGLIIVPDTALATAPPTTTTPPPTTTAPRPVPLAVVFGNDCVTGTGWLDFTSVTHTGEMVRVNTEWYYLDGLAHLRVDLSPLGNGRFAVGPTFGVTTGNVIFQFPANFIAVNSLGDFSVACNVAVPVVKQPQFPG